MVQSEVFNNAQAANRAIAWLKGHGYYYRYYHRTATRGPKVVWSRKRMR